MSTSITEALRTAVAHHQAGRFAEASAIYRDVLSVHPSNADAAYLLGLLAMRTGNPAGALSLFKTAVASNPKAGLYRRHLGICLLQLGQTENAIGEFQIAVKLAPADMDSSNYLGATLTASERFAEAEEVFRSALQLNSNCGPIWNNLGNLFRVQARADEALHAYQQAVAIDPKLGPAYSNLGNALRDRGKIPQAISAYRRAVELDPASPIVHSNLVYAACFDPDHDAHQILDEARRWADRHETPLLASQRPHDNNRDPDRRLKIGYVSGDFRDHVIGRNVLPILEHHDHASFEIHCFSTLARHDQNTAIFQQAADRWHECAMLSDAQLADKVRHEQIDILVDLSLHISGNRLLTFARKPAPIQVTWAGYPGTTGLRSIDYRITDPYLDPPGETDKFYSEKSLRLPHSFWCYRPMQGTPPVNPLPALAAGFITFGCLNNSAKVSEPALDLWADVLRQVPQSRLLMLATEGSLRSDFAAHLAGKGVDPSRLQFVGPTKPSEHLIRYQQIDISLDPLPYTGHTSTLDSLWMGVPVITLSGPTSVARGSVTALANVGLTDLIAHSPNQYIRNAAALAVDLDRLTHLRQTLRLHMQASPLCDEAQFTRDLESLYRNIWRNHE